MLAVSIVEEQLNCDLIFVYFNLRWFCLFKAGGVYLLQFSAPGSSGRDYLIFASCAVAVIELFAGAVGGAELADLAE